ERRGGGKRWERAGIKTSPARPGRRGAPGGDMGDILTAGKRTPGVRPQSARAAPRRTISQLEQALEGAEFFLAGHAALLRVMPARIDRLTADIGQLTAVIDYHGSQSREP